VPGAFPVPENRLRPQPSGISESGADNPVCEGIAGTIACITTTPKGGKTMATRTGSAVWEGTLKQGRGTMKLGSGAFEGPYSFSSRFEEGKGTNPEELIGAAEAGCYTMALSANLEKAGHPAKRVSTTATVKLEMVGGGPKITTIDLKTEAKVPGIDEAKFQEQAQLTKKTCPVSVALAGTQINLDAKLLS
jgi:osmotically inducible protein OsmC